MKNFYSSFLSVLFLFAFSSCHTTKPSASASVNDKDMLYTYQWDLTQLDDKPFYSEKGNNANLVFEHGQTIKVFGSTGCNRLSATVLFTDPNLLKFASIITTKMFCPGDNESRFTGALSKVNNWSILNNELLLSDGKILIAKLTAVSKELASALGGTWELEYVSALKNPFDSVYGQKKPYITFNLATNEISGITSCNGFTSKYTMDGNKIHIEDGLKTMMFCEGGGEEAFLNRLKKVSKYAVNGNTLTFIAGDIAVMRFTKK